MSIATTCPGDGCELQACPECTAADRIADVARDVQAWINSRQDFGDVEVGSEVGGLGAHDQLTFGAHSINAYDGESAVELVNRLAVCLAEEASGHRGLASWLEAASESLCLVGWAYDQMPSNDWQVWLAEVAVSPGHHTAAYIAYRAQIG